MALTTGTRFDHYEILSHLGAGGMGEVYRARDTKLGREVAFKVLPEEFAADPERLLRFQREGQLLATLNHPNIAQIYGVVEADRTRGIVMEFVAGETLQSRLKRGALSIDEAVAIAKQVAEAMEAAHERGVIHRDLKPGNIMIDVEGRVKVLDFGLAKALDPPRPEPGLASSPTLITAIPSSENVLIGTAAYMSPEQMRGRAASESSDIWAFGCVLFEALTGRPAFQGDTVADLIGAIVRIDPDWTLLPSNTPPALVALLKRCFEKERRRRYHAIGDVRLDLDGSHTVAAQTSKTTSHGRERFAWALVAVFAVIAGLLLFTAYRGRASVQPMVSRFSMGLPDSSFMQSVLAVPYPAISPNGRYIVLMNRSAAGSQLWLRPIDSLTVQAIPGTEGATQYPFWSPDSRFVGFFAGGKLKKIAVTGGTPQILCDADAGGGTWSEDDLILFERGGAIHRVSAAGGMSTAIRTPNKSQSESAYRWPEFLPGGKNFVYAAVNPETQRLEIRAATLDSANDRPLFTANSRVQYAQSGHLLFVNNDATLMAQPFDTRGMALKGDAFPVAERVARDEQIISGSAAFSVSGDGTLVYRGGTTTTGETELTWMDRSGKKLNLQLGDINANSLFLSFDQNRVALQKRDANQSDIWIGDLLRGTTSRITSDPADDSYPVFSNDGKRVVFLSNRGGSWGLYMKDATGAGAEELIQKVQGSNDHPNDWSPDGKTLLYVMNGDLWALSMTGERKAYPILNQRYNERRARFSPDGHWIVYTSTETGRIEIYVQPFPPTGAKSQISVEGGGYGHWTRGGKEILFDAPGGKIMAVDVKLGSTLEAGIPRELFQVPGALSLGRWDVTADGERFLLPVTRGASGPVTLTTVLNWTADIKK
jgi:serine/threonine protein kinase/Tol biopolymer transport system component